MSTLSVNGINSYVHTARTIRAGDFSRFDYVFAMDSDNLRDLKALQKRKGASGKAKVMLFGEFAGQGGLEEVADPYYGSNDGFEIAYEQCMRFSKNFLKEVFPSI